ncbi:hypothetical protein [Pseudomonas syringae]|uniref:hypothetical protein n=1 Tax=Pseudomonas syringae TaxID=317 RepID=UPI000A67B56E|nr:hypothetical protein [Pseudomonas syringae]
MKKHKEKSDPASTLLASGSLTIRDKDKNAGQLFSRSPGTGESVTYEFSSANSPFPNDAARSLQFDEFASATLFHFAADSGATDNKDQEFYFKVITTRKRTSTTIRQLINILSHAEGTIIEPGLRMLEWHKSSPDAQVIDRLSSVRIIAPTSPPTTLSTSAIREPGRRLRQGTRNPLRLLSAGAPARQQSQQWVHHYLRLRRLWPREECHPRQFAS